MGLLPMFSVITSSGVYDGNIFANRNQHFSKCTMEPEFLEASNSQKRLNKSGEASGGIF